MQVLKILLQIFGIKLLLNSIIFNKFKVGATHESPLPMRYLVDFLHKIIVVCSVLTKQYNILIPSVILAAALCALPFLGRFAVYHAHFAPLLGVLSVQKDWPIIFPNA